MPIDGGVVYAPYTLIVKAGALSYTNISYVRGSTDKDRSGNILSRKTLLHLQSTLPQKDLT